MSRPSSAAWAAAACSIVSICTSALNSSFFQKHTTLCTLPNFWNTCQSVGRHAIVSSASCIDHDMQTRSDQSIAYLLQDLDRDVVLDPGHADHEDGVGLADAAARRRAVPSRF
jgi:hypothetical protein